MPTEEQGEPTEFRQRVGSVEDQLGTGSEARSIGMYLLGSEEEEEVVNSELDVKLAEAEDEGPNELAGGNEGRRYPLRNRRPPLKISGEGICIFKQ